ncbi:hypothetical protein [Streptomyces sp. AGS-58]|uniref:hypothetical protein n=1 Tax=unclassified Streptomyces TaxID=2593676 RepID=UPI0035A30AAB
MTNALTVRCQTCGGTWVATDEWGGTVAYCTGCAKTGGPAKARPGRPCRVGVIDGDHLTEDGNRYSLKYLLVNVDPGSILEDVITPDYIVGNALYRTGIVADADGQGWGVAWPAVREAAGRRTATESTATADRVPTVTEPVDGPPVPPEREFIIAGQDRGTGFTLWGIVPAPTDPARRAAVLEELGVDAADAFGSVNTEYGATPREALGRFLADMRKQSGLDDYGLTADSRTDCLDEPAG